MKQETARLLRECSEGIEMGVGAIDRVLTDVKDPEFRKIMMHCRHRHRDLGREIAMRLDAAGIPPKKLHPMVSTMARLEIEWRMRLHPKDQTAATLLTKGCNMGILCLSRLLNQYPDASEASRNLTKALIESEELLLRECRPYL